MPQATEVTIQIPALYKAQRTVRENARRYNILAWGRRGGKTTFGSDLVTETCIDQGGKLGYFGPNFVILDPVWNYYVNKFSQIIDDKDEVKKYMRLKTGGIFECWSMHSDAIIVARSRDYDRAIVDEAAHIKNLKKRLEYEILPTLIDRTGDLWLFSSTNGEDDFKTFYDMGKNPNEEEWYASQVPTWENPFLPKKERDRVYKLAVVDRDPVARQEYGAEFLTGSDNFVNPAWVNACSLPGEHWEPLPIGTPLCVGIDVGTKNDLFAITGWGKSAEVYDTNTGELIKGRKYKPAFVKAFHPADLTGPDQKVDFTGPKEFLRMVAKNYHIISFVFDPYQALGLADDMTKEGIGFFEEFNQGQKRVLADSLFYTLIRDMQLEWFMHDETCKELSQHIKNANAKIEGEDKRRLVKRTDELKIDLAVSSSMAIFALQDYNI